MPLKSREHYAGYHASRLRTLCSVPVIHWAELLNMTNVGGWMLCIAYLDLQGLRLVVPTLQCQLQALSIIYIQYCWFVYNVPVYSQKVPVKVTDKCPFRGGGGTQLEPNEIFPPLVQSVSCPITNNPSDCIL